MAIRRFIEGSDLGDLAMQVQAVKETARNIVLEHGVGLDLAILIREVAGEFPMAWDDGAPGEVWAIYCRHINAAYAIGIVVGQIVHTEAFASTPRRGGTR